MSLWLAGLLLLAGALLPCGVRADTYEWHRTERLLAQQGLTLAEAPEGRRIAWVRVVRDDVFVEDEIWPTWLSRWFHVKTREGIVRRELLFGEGGTYHDVRVEETMRNLRGMGIFALVRIVPVQVDEPDAVGVVVHTRDLWSLRLETGFNITTQLDQLTLRLTELNFLGRNKQVAVDTTIIPMSYTLREFFDARRVWGSTFTLQESAAIVMNRERGQPEGSIWLLKLGQPFYSLRQRFAWTAAASYDNIVARRLVKGNLSRFREPSDTDATGPYGYRAWRQQVAGAAASAFLRLGDRFKQSWSVGVDYRSVEARATRETQLPEELRAYFEQKVLPRQRTEVGPTFSYEVWIPQYTRFENLATFGMSENVRIGPRASLSARAPIAALGSTRGAWVFVSSVGVTLAPGGFLLEAAVAGRTRYERQRLMDQRLDALVRGATPVFFNAFRLVARAALEARRNDTANTYVTLGASNGLRGYTSQAISGFGASRLLANFELRTLPIEWQAVHVGAVLFYDVGSVYHELRSMNLSHAVGVGLRVLFPQFNRMPFAFDGGTSYDPGFRFVPTISSGQVVPLTAVEDVD